MKHIQFLIALTAALLCGEAAASPAGDSLRTRVAKLTAVAPDSPEFPAVVDGNVDHAALAAATFEGLDGGTSAERAEARKLLVDVVRVAVARQVGRLRRAEVKWGVEMKDGRDRVVVKSVVAAGSDRVDVDWVVAGRDWRLVDVVTEGVSMTATWRRQLRAAHGKGGWPAVLKKLRKAGEATDGR